MNNDDIVNVITNSFSVTEKENLNIETLLNFIQHTQKNINKICIAGTPYGLLLYLLFIKDFSKTLFIFYGNYPLSDAIDELRKQGYVCLETGRSALTVKENDLYLSIIKYLSSNINQYPVTVYGQDTSPIVNEFINDRFVLFEDGRISYISRADAKKTKGFHVNIYDSGINTIIYTGLEPIPKELQCIAQIVDLKEQWNSMNYLHQKLTLKVFGFDIMEISQLISSGRDTILFTRNYSKVGKCSEANQIHMYTDILSNYDNNKIIIKPHPNDDIDYKQFFGDCIVLPKKMPAELIQFCNLPIKKVVSVDATSNVFGVFSNVEIDLYTEMIEKYHIIKTRNTNS